MEEEIHEIQNYVLKEDIGKGNFGKVKRAIYKPTNEEFAIKIINKKILKIKMKNVIFKENEIITKFNHINVIFVYQIIDTPENYFIVMEYCKKGELFDYIVKNKRLSENEASIFFYQIINGVEYIHSKGIAHRDLKPENLLLTEDNILKIIDFGLSHEFNGEDFLKTKCGSPSYASPEIISHPFYDGFKTDIWCCGIILYAMLCGYLPFDGESKENNSKLFKNIVQCNIEFPEFISEISKDLIIKLLTVNPNQRIKIQEIKNHPFYLKGKNLCKLDYSSIEEEIIKKRSFKSIINITENNINKDINNNKTFSNENNNINKKDDYILEINIVDNNKSNENLNSNIDNYTQIKSNKEKPMNYKLHTDKFYELDYIDKKKTNPKNYHQGFYKQQLYLKNNKLLNTETNQFNLNLLSMIKTSKKNNLNNQLFNTKIYNETIEPDKLYNNNNNLSNINNEKRNYNIFKQKIRNVIKQEKTFFHFNPFEKNKNKYIKQLENSEYIKEKKLQNSNDSRAFNDEIFLRNLRKNLMKKEIIKKEKFSNFFNKNYYQLKNSNINIENKNNSLNKIISLSNDKIKRKDLGINDKLNEVNNLKTIPKNEEESISSYNTKMRIFNNKNKNENLSLKTSLYNNSKQSINSKDNNSFVNKTNKNINKLNKENINKSDNNYKRNGLSLEKKNLKNPEKINLTKLLQTKNNENDFIYKSIIKRKNKSYFNGLTLNNKTIESYGLNNRNNTIDNYKIPINLTKKIKEYNFENTNGDLKNVFLKNRINILKMKNYGNNKDVNNNFLPILTDSNRNVNFNIKNIL